ncbi:hypothetical protein F7Q99_21070 [Streptomyces kaniharaensis]|uniref:Uncharacterized protein n=1 Tax=Streptomyces kaniharaensis TaxID=212423 RepID=A0A6N7KWM1_9ACTN|nr:hypothetical protein [Streptomyces kaniharaensis]MQS14688.1 hypothetical protein [Streptomyces kaniharaensis]
MYSYDVSASPGRSTTAPRSIPGMRPSYDAEHPHSTTPIYDELYSEYRRLFRALPGDRSGEEDLKFTGFASRDGYPVLGEPRPYPPQQQAFRTQAGQPVGVPQFVPTQQDPQTQPRPHPEPANPTSDGFGQAAHHSPTTHQGVNSHHPQSGNQSTPHPQSAQHAPPAAQFTDGQGWVAAGYLGPTPHPVPAPPPAPSPLMGTAPSTGGRHRQMLSLPSGRNGDHH